MTSRLTLPALLALAILAGGAGPLAAQDSDPALEQALADMRAQMQQMQGQMDRLMKMLPPAGSDAAGMGMMDMDSATGMPGMPPHGDTVGMEFIAANQRMMAAMQQPVTDDADRNFATMMLPHHAGAIDMAQLELKHGKDPQLRALAEKIVAAQQAEIGELRSWLEQHLAQ